MYNTDRQTAVEAATMNPITLSLTNLQPGANFVRVGIPLPKGSVQDCDTLTIDVDQIKFAEVPVQSRITPTAHWSDGSVKWCLAKIATLSVKTPELDLKVHTSAPIGQPSLVEAKEDSDRITVNSGDAIFEFRKSSVFPSVNYAGTGVWQEDSCMPLLVLEDDSLCDLQVADVSLQENDGLTCKIQISGVYNINDTQTLHAKFIFEVMPNAQMSLICELHNPHRALHPGGIWDLGDSGSIKFKDFSFAIQNPDQSLIHLLAEPGADWIDVKQPTSLFQASSGGEHWNNAVHVNAAGNVCNQFCGYQVSNGDKNVHAGKRADPSVAIECSGSAYSIKTSNFWQNFPKSIDVDSNKISLRLFPFHHGDLYELQGGERKRHEIDFTFEPSLSESKKNNNTHKPFACVAATAYREADVFRYFDDQYSCQKYESLLDPSKSHKTGFYAKREHLDEYSWRNFGDIYADHEAAYHTELKRPYVSHYNNQYDAVYGFIRQYALTGDHFWQPLTTDLAKHIMDIDIYRTEEDRAEYNNGFFWHTDHYVEAQTASHRTYSINQIDHNGQPQKGGGPSSGHCYSTGLMYYYFMTGDEEAKKTVINLGNWITHYQEGSGTLIETVRKTLQEDTANFIKTCKGTKTFKYRYRMDRETGNYIRTLMDCYDLTADSDWLHKVETIIERTAGPHDNIDARDFKSVEYTWFYIVFLQEVVRYLDLKRSLDQHDNKFYYARAILLHYAKWMVENEQPYLHDSENLDYPNATWIAQETRKVAVLFAAYKYALKDRTIFLERARYFRDYLVEELSQSDTLHFARIQILLLQNHGPSAMIDTDSLPYPGLRDVVVADQDDCFYTPGSHFKHIAGTLMSSLAKFRISNELRWIRNRAS